MKIEFRAATHDDAEHVATLLRRSFRDVAERFDLDGDNAPTGEVTVRCIALEPAADGVIAEHTELVAWCERLGFAPTEARRFPHLPFTVSYLERLL